MTDATIRILQTDVSEPQVRRHMNTEDISTKKVMIDSAYFSSRNSYRSRSEAPVSTMVADSIIPFKPVLTQNSAMFTTDVKFDRLHNVFLCTTLPSFVIKNRYKDTHRICWSTCPGRYLIESVVLKDIEGIVLNTFTSETLTIYDVFYNPKSDDWNQSIGNVEELTEWNTQLPEYDLSINVPLFFSLSRDMGLPFDRKNSDKISITFKTRPFVNLLRMQRKNADGVFVEVKMNEDILIKTTPSKEMNLKACISSEDTRLHKTFRKMNIISIDYTEIRQIAEQKTALTDGTAVEIPLTADAISEALFLTVKLKNREGLKDYGLFPKSDRPLLETFKLNIGSSTFIDTISNQRFYNSIRDTHFLEASNDSEIYCIPLTRNPGNLDGQNTGVNLHRQNGKLTLTFGNGKYVYAKEAPTDEELEKNLQENPVEKSRNNEDVEVVINVYGLVQLNVTYRYNENSDDYFVALEDGSKGTTQPRDSRDHEEDEYNRNAYQSSSNGSSGMWSGQNGSGSSGPASMPQPAAAHLRTHTGGNMTVPTPVHFTHPKPPHLPAMPPPPSQPRV